MAEKKKVSLEAAMARLEEIVSEMESEKLPLDKSLKLYEEGIGLVARCSEELEAAKKLGFHGIVVESYEQAKKELEKELMVM